MNTSDPSDPYVWLEDVSGQKALNWAKELNTESTKELASKPDFESLRVRLLKIMDSKEKIPQVTKHGKLYYNFWKDKDHVRGIWRRTSFDEYKKPDTKWELVIDLDKLAKEENDNWVWHGAHVLYHDWDRALIELSRGGSDAVVIREFDLNKKEFVKDGFYLPEAKSHIAWRDRNTVYVGTDFGTGSLTKSGYPRIVKEWKRGSDLNTAKTVFEGKPDDVSVSAYVINDHGFKYELISRGITFFTDETHILRNDSWQKIDKPADADFSPFSEEVFIRLRSDWKLDGKTFKAGSLLLTKVDDYLAGKREFQVLFEPGPRTSLGSCSDTKNFLIQSELENVRSKLYWFKKDNGIWKKQDLETPKFGTISAFGIDSDESDDYFMFVSDYLTPTTLYSGTLGETKREKLKSQPEFFKTEGLQIQQFEASSKDGSKIPYFLVAPKNMKLDGSNPTLLYGYGGFEISLLPSYDPKVGAAWLERGGAYVVANIRGGSEFGPDWHNAARKENRQRSYDDFIAVAEDLISRKITSSKHLGIQGYSNGGLLMGVMYTQRPDLFGAIHCGVPLLDMRRYNKLLAGASWMDEYGDPDKDEEWSYISKYSPYQNVKKNGKYPPILFTTSTRDDRVHPGHARKMVALLKSQGHDVTYYENIEGGHGGAANNEQAAFMSALAYTFLWEKLK